MKNKGVFFVKKEKRPIPEGNIDIAEYLAIGDVYPNVLGMSALSFHSFYTFKNIFRPFMFLGGGGAGSHIQ